MFQIDKVEIGGVYHQGKNVLVVQKDLHITSNDEPIYNAYNIFNLSKKQFDFYPCHIAPSDLKEKLGDFKVVFKGQIPHYKEAFIGLRPEYFI